MARFLTLSADPNSAAGGSSFDDLVSGNIPLGALADLVIPTTAQADPGVRNLERDDDVRNYRGESPPVSFGAAPSLSFGSRAWVPLVKRLLPKALGGSVASTGVAPAAINSVVQAAGVDAILPALNATLVRSGQTDRLCGAWFSEFTLDAPAEGEATIEASLMALYHDVDDTSTVSGLPAPTGADGASQVEAFMLRDVKAYLGPSAGTLIDCLSGFSFTLNNALTDDWQARACAGKNIVAVTLDGVTHRIWYPEKNKTRGRAVTGRLDFSDVRPDRELRRILSHCEKLVVELGASAITPATTPPADQMLRLTFYNQAPSGGGAGPLVRDGDQTSSYEFTAYLDPVTGKDLEATFVDKTAVPANLHTS